ncbi:MAG: hypothetical protein OEW12_06160 [Deltaproteobacteria bacterium]|nr:hypothetical protein [Deltaproteobacteria bacterium]
MQHSDMMMVSTFVLIVIPVGIILGMYWFVYKYYIKPEKNQNPKTK